MIDILESGPNGESMFWTDEPELMTELRRAFGNPVPYTFHGVVKAFHWRLMRRELRIAKIIVRQKKSKKGALN